MVYKIVLNVGDRTQEKEKEIVDILETLGIGEMTKERERERSRKMGIYCRRGLGRPLKLHPRCRKTVRISYSRTTS